MADYQAIAKKYGADANWNSLRGTNDPLFAGLDPNANWNSFRPQASASPSLYNAQTNPSGTSLPPSGVSARQLPWRVQVPVCDQ
jgi:hypothetical protein